MIDQQRPVLTLSAVQSATAGRRVGRVHSGRF